MHNDYNIVAITLAALVHALLVVGMLFAFDFSRDQMPATPLAIKGSLVVEADIPRSPDPDPEPVATEPDPEPEPEPEPEPDLAEEQRRVAEEQKRLEEQQAEQERIREEQAAERERQQKAAEEQRRREEAEKERQRQEAERKRLEDLERQRAENERRRREAEEAERQRRLAAELAAEEALAAAMNSGEMARYRFALQQAIQRKWVQPASSHSGIECVVLARQAPGGTVIDVKIERCNGDAAVQRSIIAAVNNASPLPQPENPVLFQRDLRITVKPEQ